MFSPTTWDTATLGAKGLSIQTPNIDALAENGVRFTDFYNTARCCPARARLLTGLYLHQAGIGGRSYVGDLDDHSATIAEVLKPAGYGTYMSGKWHLTYHKYCSPDGPKHSWPCQRGFDRFSGILGGSGSYSRPQDLREDSEPIEAEGDFYLTDAISDRACDYNNDHAMSRPNDPWFLYVAYADPHWPLHARPEDVSRYRGSYGAGWDMLRKQNTNG